MPAEAVIGTSVAAPQPDVGRTLHVMHVVWNLRAGGSENGIVNVVNGLDRARFRPSVCSCRPVDAFARRLAPHVDLFAFRRADGNDPQFILQLLALLRRERPDIVHTHGWGTLVEGYLAARLAGVPIIVHGEHGTIRTRPLAVKVQRSIWSRIDRVLSVSSGLSARMAAEIGFALSDIQTIRNGVDLSRFSPRDRTHARRAIGLPDQGFLVGTVGRLVPVKDHSTFLRALAVVRARGVACDAVLVGEGPLASRLREECDRLGLDNVRLLGHREDVPVVLAALDLFVLSSISEGLSNTILEAMATGLPVVATRVGGAEEIVVHGRTGLLVPPSDPEALAAALTWMAAAPAERAEMGRRGRERAVCEFRLERMVREYEELYTALACRSRHVAGR